MVKMAQNKIYLNFIKKKYIYWRPGWRPVGAIVQRGPVADDRAVNAVQMVFDEKIKIIFYFFFHQTSSLQHYSPVVITGLQPVHQIEIFSIFFIVIGVRL